MNGCFFGSVIGPNANRIANAKFNLDGVEYHLDPNDGVNNLHSHKELGSHKRVWDACEVESGVVLLWICLTETWASPETRRCRLHIP